MGRRMRLGSCRLLVLALLALVPSSGAEDGDLDSLIAGVFNPPGTDSGGPPPGPGALAGDGEGKAPSGIDQGGGMPPPGGGEPPVPPPPQGGGGGDDCECVPYYLCANGTIIDNGVGIIDIRFKECDSYLDVCCKAPLPVTEPVTPPPKGHVGCGRRNPDGVGFRITGYLDNEAQFGEFPWMVAILREELLEDGTKLNVYQCGGALIHKKVVMTAAHCVAGREPSVLKLRAGEWDTQTKEEILPYQDRSVVQIIGHEKYYAGALYNDIALLIVAEPFEYADNVDIVCLPKQNDIVIHKSCFASGWGKDKFGKEGNYQVILKKIELPIVPRAPCIDALRKTRLGPYFRLHESFICAGGELGKDTCKGDGGGPLVCPVPGKQDMYQQVGMVAWGVGCGQEEVPAVYVNVAHFRNWIDQKMSKLGLQPEYAY